MRDNLRDFSNPALESRRDRGSIVNIYTVGLLSDLFGDREACAAFPAAGEEYATTGRSRGAGKEPVGSGALSFLRLVRSFRHVVHRIVPG